MVLLFLVLEIVGALVLGSVISNERMAHIPDYEIKVGCHLKNSGRKFETPLPPFETLYMLSLTKARTQGAKVLSAREIWGLKDRQLPARGLLGPPFGGI